MPTFLDGVLLIAYNQDNAIAGYYEDTSGRTVEIHRLEDAIDEILDTVLGSLEVEESKPVLAEMWRLTTPDRCEYRLVFDGKSYPLPGDVVIRIISQQAKVDWSQRFITGQKNSIQINMFHELSDMLWDIINVVAFPHGTDDDLARYGITAEEANEWLGEQPSYQDRYVSSEWRAFFVDGQIVYKEGEGLPPVDVEVRRPSKDKIGGKNTWKNPDAKPFKFEDLAWYQKEILHRR